jgi:chemotaxis protein methyltransferase CheR
VIGRMRISTTFATGGIPEPTEHEFDGFRDVIRRHAGIHLTTSKKALLYSRLAQRVHQLGLRSFGEYLGRVLQDADELERMTDRIATNETRFFREPQHFDFLSETALPTWQRAAEAGQRPKEVRIWSAGCSTGEEPYSLAMTLLDRLTAAWSIAILATDISTRVLDAARQATWSMHRAQEIPPRLRKQFMLQGIGSQTGRLRAGPELRALVRVEALNLNAAAYAVGGPFDMVLCRNVLIYFDQEHRRRILERLASHVAPGGYLLVGHAESVQGIASVSCVQPTIYWKRDPSRDKAG